MARTACAFTLRMGVLRSLDLLLRKGVQHARNLNKAGLTKGDMEYVAARLKWTGPLPAEPEAIYKNKGVSLGEVTLTRRWAAERAIANRAPTAAVARPNRSAFVDYLLERGIRAVAEEHDLLKAVESVLDDDPEAGPRPDGRRRGEKRSNHQAPQPTSLPALY